VAFGLAERKCVFMVLKVWLIFGIKYALAPKTIKIKLISCLFLIINFLGISAQTKQDSIVNSLMQQQKWFDVRDYLSQNKDSISEMYYLATKSVVDTYFNKPDSAIMNMGILLNQYSKELGGSTFHYAMLMVKNLAEVQKYDEAINLLNDILRQVGNALPKSYNDNLNSWVSSLEFYKNYPYRVVFNENGPLKTDFEMQKEGIGLESKANGVKLKIAFDTGSSLNRISKETADRIGVHSYLPDTVYTNPQTKVLKGIIDSIEIGNIKIYNCQVDVTFEKPDLPISQMTPEEKEKFSNSIDSAENANFIGISTMKLIGIIDIDFFNKKISFEQSNSQNQQPSNIFRIDNILYFRTTLNNQPFTSIFDTGNSLGTFIYKDYYDRYKEHFSLKDDQEHEILIYLPDFGRIKYKKLNDIELNSCNQLYNLTNVMVALNRPLFYLPDYPVPDGIIGVDFVKLLKSMRLDFKNMCITFEKERR
jgi:hypothetical protein